MGSRRGEGGKVELEGNKVQGGAIVGAAALLQGARIEAIGEGAG
jgi:hypothetical protein